MSNLSRHATSGLLTVMLIACGGPPKFQMFESELDCTETECVLVFDIENLTASELTLSFDISLTQNYVFDPAKSGLVVVGHKSGQYSLPPSQKVTFAEPVAVTEEANGSKLVVEVADDT